MINKFVLLTGASCAALTGSSAFADDAKIIPPIVITATRSETPLNQIASSMTVVTNEEIERKKKPTVAELLREVPGITIANSGGFGQSTRIFMRGTNSEHTLVLMDGVAINDPSDPSNAFDFSNLTTDNIERIEILRGAQSTLYGSQAIGGVINIITKKGKGDPRHNAFAEYGRYNSSKIGGGSAGDMGNTSYSFSASNSHTNGISSFDKKFGGFEKDGSNTYTFAGNLESRLSDKFTSKFNARYNRTVSDFDSPGSAGVGGLRPDDDRFPNSDSRQFNGRAAGVLSLLDGKWVQELGISTVNYNRALITEYFDSAFSPYFGRQQYTGHRDVIDWVHHLKMLPKHLITIGAESSTEYFKKISPIEGLLSNNVDNMAFFADDQYNIDESAFLNYGARIDDHQSFGRQFTWKVAPGYRINETGTLLKATYGTGFKAPSLSQLFDPTSGNRNLNPEKSKSWDAGFEQTLMQGKIVFGATAFRNDITNMIGFAAAPLYKANNNKARTEGVESSFVLKPSLDCDISVNYTYTLPQDRKNDQELLRRPRHQANLSSFYRYSINGDVGMNIRYVGKSRDWDYATSSFVKDIKSFTTIGLITNYQINPNVTAYSRIDNLLDRRYEEIDGYGQPGMSLFGGVKFSY